MRGSRSTERRAGRRPWMPLARFHRDQDGQAMFVVVIFFFLLAGLLFLILNSGQMLNRKVQMQNAADSATAGGAAWYARSLNTISMANVVETQLLSLIVLLDSIETVTPPAVQCIDDLVNNLGAAKAGRDMPIDPRLSQWLVVGNAASEQEIMHQFGSLVAAVNWPDYLTYDTGVLWECAKLMDGFSHTMATEAPLVIQREAIDIAQKNHAEFGFVLPLWPRLPIVDGHMPDFRNPMVSARMPVAWRSTPIRGFDQVMNYVGYHGQRLGPWSYWREPFTATQPMGLFDISRFSSLFNMVSAMKLNMLFGAADDRVTLTTWEMDYDKAKSLAFSGRIRRSWWESSSFDARYEAAETVAPYPPPAAGAWDALHSPAKPIPTTIPRTQPDGTVALNGWYDPVGGGGGGAGYTRATQYYEGADARLAVWYRVDRRQTPHYPQLGIYAPHPPTQPGGAPWPYAAGDMHTYWHVTLWRFNGAELETDQTLHRNYLPPAGADPFGPILLDPTTGDNLVANINEQFTLNGFALRSGQISDWSQRFANPNPTKDTVAFAQARIYNRYSWDLFTQHWRVKLMRTDRWKSLINEVDQPLPAQAGPVAASFTAERLESVRKILDYYPDAWVQEVAN